MSTTRNSSCPPRPGSAFAHPVVLGDTLAAWSELFADYEILQPFPQLGRPVHTLAEEERAATRLDRLISRVAPYGKVKGLSQGRWKESQAHNSIARADPAGRYLIVNISPGLSHYMYGGGDDQRYTSIWAGHSPGPEPTDPLPLGDIDPVTISEALHDLTRISTS